MKRKWDFKVGDVLLVHWRDAHSVDEWVDPSEVEVKTEPRFCFNVGFFLKASRHSLVLAASIPPKIGGDDEAAAGMWIIPKGMVISVEKIRDDTRERVNGEHSSN